jgi:cell division protein FtsB
MRIKRSVARFFALMVLPAVTVTVVGYFGSHAIWGERGILVLEDAQGKLALRQQELAGLGQARARLEHRIALMGQATPDSDLVEELARTELMDGAPNQVAVSRQAR